MRVCAHEIVKYPHALSEAEIQASIWAHLVSMGYDARIEVPFSGAYGNFSTRKVYHRIDIVVFRSGIPVIAFEVKSSQEKKKTGRTRHSINQRMNYTWLVNCGLPVHYVCSIEEALSNLEAAA